MIGLELERFLSNYFSEIPAKSIICIDQVPIRMKKPEFTRFLTHLVFANRREDVLRDSCHFKTLLFLI
jgi:hypothetical protein